MLMLIHKEMYGNERDNISQSHKKKNLKFKKTLINALQQ